MRRGPYVAWAACLLIAVFAPSTLLAQAVGAGWETDFERHVVPLEDIVSGGPPKDGIPALDEPRFVSVREAARWLADDEPVVVVEHEGFAKAYPYQILIWHEIVNDRVGELPVVVTYCPLCNTALVFHRLHDGELLDFGTTGRLRYSDLVMYDRQTESWWQQATGEGLVGRYAGESLRYVPAQSTSWETFREENPDGLVLSRETGYERPYGENPYVGYDRREGPFDRFFGRAPDDRLPAMERVVAIRDGEAAVAYPFSRLREDRVVNDRLDDQSLVVFWAPGAASALDAANIAEGRDVGATGVFVRELDGRTLSFRAVGDGRFEDRETASTWTLTGRAVAGPLDGSRLERITHGDYFWFAWAAFVPGTEVRR